MLDDLIKTLTTQIGLSAEDAKKVVGAVLDFLKNKVPGDIGGQVSKLLAGIDKDGDGDIVEELIGGLTGGLMGNLNAAGGKAQGLLESLTGSLGGMLGDAAGTAQSAAGDLSKAVGTAKATAEQKAGGLMDNISKGVNDLLGGADSNNDGKLDADDLAKGLKGLLGGN